MKSWCVLLGSVSPSRPWCRRSRRSTGWRRQRTAWTSCPSEVWSSWGWWSRAAGRGAKQTATSVYCKRPLQVHTTTTDEPTTVQASLPHRQPRWAPGPVIKRVHLMCLQQVPGHWKGTNGPSPSASSSSFSLFSLSSFSVSLPSSWSSWQILTALSAPETPFSIPRLLPPFTGTSESPLVKVWVLMSRCLCITKD